jgi:rubredoxin
VSLSPAERLTALSIAQDHHHAARQCPDCGKSDIHVHDDGVSGPYDNEPQWPLGAYLLCEDCGWSWDPSYPDPVPVRERQVMVELTGMESTQ